VALVTGVVAAVIVGLALPASAHSASLSGSTQCFNEDHLVTWHITNSSQTSTLLMAVTSIEAKIGNTTYAVTGYTTPLAKGASTDGTSTVPGGVTGTITATMHTTWPDGVTDTDIESVTLEENCVSTTTTSASTSTSTTTTSTTTTTVPETTTTVAGTTTIFTTTTTVPETTTTTTVPETTTTTVPETTTTVAGTTTIFTTTTTVPETTTTTVPETTTTTVPETTTTAGPTTSVLGSTTIFTTTTTAPTTTTPVTDFGSTVPIPTVIDQATTTTVPGATALPRTGSSSGYVVFFGLSCIAGGALLAIRRRRSWIK
jgi:LPXTG-motif cell wall-anchored protein